MGSSKGGGSQTTTQKTEPWGPQQNYLRQGFQQAQQLYNTPRQYYGGQGYVPFSSQTEQGLGMMEQRALNGSPAESALSGYVTNTLNNPGGGQTANYLQGMQLRPDLGYAQNALSVDPQSAQRGRDVLSNVQTYGIDSAGTGPGFANNTLQRASQGPNYEQAASAAGVGTDKLSQFNGRDPNIQNVASGGMIQNPFLDRMFDSAASRVTEKFNDEVLPGIGSQFTGAGGSGSRIQGELATDAAGELSQTLGQMAGNIYGSAYESERDRQMQGLGLGLQERGQNIGAAATSGQQDIARRGQAQGFYLGGQGQGIDAARTALGDDLGRFNAGSNLFTATQGQRLGAGGQLLSDDLSRRAGANSLYGTQGGLGLGAANAYTGLYGAQNNAQQGAAGMVPQTSALDYNNIGRLLGVGSAVEGKSGEAINDAMNRHNFQQTERDDALARYISAIQGNYGSYSTGQNPSGSPITGALGGASLGAGLASGLGLASPWGWGLAGLGALGGMIS